MRSGRIILLNGAPRAGKSTIAAAIQEAQPGKWVNFGADVFIRHVLPPELRPGIGLRPPVPGDEKEAACIARQVPQLYHAFHCAIAALCESGMNVVADIAYHDAYAKPERDARECFVDLDVFFVGVHCPIETIMERRNAGQEGREGEYATAPKGEIPEAVLRWQEEVHRGRKYDYEVDTSEMEAEDCAETILSAFEAGPPWSFDDE